MMEQLVFIHGAWHKASCWDKLIYLMDEFAMIFTPNLVIESDYRQIHLETYLELLSALFSNIDGPFTIVAHSFGGIVAREVGNLFPNQIKQIIYINGLIPIEGESLFSLTNDFYSKHLNPYFDINANYQEIKIHPAQNIHRFMYQTMPIDTLDLTHFRGEPLIPLNERFSGKRHQIPEKAIISKNDLCIHELDQIAMCTRENIPYQIIDSDHGAFQSHPLEIAKLIKEYIADV